MADVLRPGWAACLRNRPYFTPALPNLLVTALAYRRRQVGLGIAGEARAVIAVTRFPLLTANNSARLVSHQICSGSECAIGAPHLLPKRPKIGHAAAPALRDEHGAVDHEMRRASVLDVQHRLDVRGTVAAEALIGPAQCVRPRMTLWSVRIGSSRSDGSCSSTSRPAPAMRRAFSVAVNAF